MELLLSSTFSVFSSYFFTQFFSTIKLKYYWPPRSAHDDGNRDANNSSAVDDHNDDEW